MAESSIFAKVTSLTGEAYVRNAEGQLRQLKLGDVIREGESVVSSDNAQVVLQLADGRQLSVVPGDVVRIDAEVAAETKPDATDSAVSNDPKALTDLTQALASGQNLDELLESPAAGIPGVGNEGHTFVEFARIVESVSPLAFEYGTARGVELYPYDGGGAYTRGDGEADTRGDGGTNDGTPPPGNQTPGNLQPTTPVNYVPTVQSFSVDFIEDGGNYTVDGDVLDGSTLGNGTAAEHEFAWDNPAASSQYGAITLKPDGTYTFELDNDSAVVQALAPGQQVTETFTYTYTDVDGDLATGTLTITITGTNDVPTVNSFSHDFTEGTGNHTVNGDVLDGSTLGDGTAAEHEFAWDNPAASSQYGAITLKPDGSYTFELDTDSAVVQALTQGQQVTETFTYTYTDVDGDPATGTLTITITGTNSVPTVNSFSHDFTEGTGNHTVNGDVLDGSTLGDGTAAEHEFAWDNPAASSQYGAITLKPDGSYTFELDTDSAVVQALTQGQQVTETFTYTYTDVDGDPATGTLTITITGTNSVPTVNSFSHDFTEGTGNHTVNGDVLDGSTLGDGTAAEHEFAWDNPAASSQYGAITLKPDGSYTFELDTDSAVVKALTQGQQVTETFTYTYTDVDGDPATGTLTITITGTNSVPTITVDQGNVGGTNDVVYEAGLQPHGSDAGNATTTAHGSITVSAPDGLDSIESVTINSETFTVNGDLDALVNQSVSTDFGRLTITGHDGNGKLTYRYELTDPVDNDSEPDATDDSYSDIFTLTVFDGTDHSASANIVIEIVDDVPRVSQAMPMDISNSIGAVGLGALNFYDNIGADREGSEIVFQGTNGALLTSNGSNVTSGGQNIVLTGFGTDVLTGTTTGGKIVFQITLNPDAVDKANDAYTVELFQKFDDGSHISFSGNLGLKQNNIAFKLYDGGQDFDILFSGANPKSGQPTVNSNTGGFGVGNPSFEGREIIRADFVKGGSEGNTFSYTGDRYDVDSFIFSVTTANATIDVRLYDGGADNEMGATKTVGTGGQVAIAAIYIYVNGEWQVPDSNSITPDGNGGYTLSNLPMNAQIQVVGEQPFGAVEIENSGTTDTQLNLHGYSIAAEGMGNSIDLNFALQLTDGDGDTAAGSLHLTVQPAGATLGDASATHGQALVGGSGDDTLIGGAGNDTLTGGLGADTFVWHLADKSPTPGTPAVDTVTDFGNGDDKLDLRDLLQHADQNHLDQYLHFESDGSGGTILHVSTGGGFAGGAHIPGAEDQTILLQGVDLVGSNIGDQQQIITDLLAQGKLLVDHN